MNVFIKTKFFGNAILLAALSATCATAYASNPSHNVNESVPYKAIPNTSISTDTIAKALGIKQDKLASFEEQQLRWATKSLNNYGVTRFNNADNTVTTLWYANNPSSGPYKGHSGLVIKECNRQHASKCVSKAI